MGLFGLSGLRDTQYNRRHRRPLLSAASAVSSSGTDVCCALCNVQLLILCLVLRALTPCLVLRQCLVPLLVLSWCLLCLVLSAGSA
jgi:hypothetical protein